MQRRVVGSLAHYVFPSLSSAPGLTHSISTRHGGTSLAPFHTLNLSYSAGDDPQSVTSNIRCWHTSLGLDPDATVTASQAHSGSLAIVGTRHRGTRIAQVDALLTKESGVPLMLRYADCVPILLFDPVQRAIAVVHAGWRGTVSKIITNTIKSMSLEFGTCPQDLIACIGPSIGPCCYSVREDVISLVRSSYAEAETLLISRDAKTFLDLWQANALQLRALGVEHIEIAGLCTADHTDDFFSARAEQPKTGRFGAIIALNRV